MFNRTADSPLHFEPCSLNLEPFLAPPNNFVVGQDFTASDCLFGPLNLGLQVKFVHELLGIQRIGKPVE